jgi:hypothetical protein
MRIAVLIALTIPIPACVHNVYTPPARAFPLETPETLKAGKYGLAGEVSAHGKTPDVGAGTLRVRRGIEDNLEASVEVTYAKVGNETAANTNPNLFAGRAGIRLQPDEMKSIGLSAGLGGGTFAGGPYVSADAGANLAYEMCRVTPFVGASGYVSTPLDAREVDTSEEGMMVGQFVDKPETTAGLTLRVGLSLNVSSCEARDKSIVVGFGLDHYWDDDSDRGYASGGAAFTFNLD